MGPNRRQWKQLDWRSVPRAYSLAGIPFYTYTLNEMLQAIDCYRGKIDIPEQYHPLCYTRVEEAPRQDNSPIDSADVALAEPNTSHEIIFEGIYLNRRPVFQLFEDIRESVPQVRGLWRRWFDQGLVAMDEEARRASAEELLRLIPESTPRFDLVEAVLRRARGARSNPKQGMERLASALDCPLGIVTYTWSYMPDGRALSWPAEFYGEIFEAAQNLGLPILEPWRVVQQAGVPSAMEKDRRHYQDGFIPVIAGAIVEFAMSIAPHSRRDHQNPARTLVASEGVREARIANRRRTRAARRAMASASDAL